MSLIYLTPEILLVLLKFTVNVVGLLCDFTSDKIKIKTLPLLLLTYAIKALLGRTRVWTSVDLHKCIYLDAGDEERQDTVNLHSSMVCPQGHGS